MTGAPRLLIWTSMPTHHQSAFFAALRARPIDLAVHYYRKVDASRLSMGWDAHDRLPAGERYVAESLKSLDHCPDWRERVHVVPGCNSLFLLRLAWLLCRKAVPWVHWSEHSRPLLSRSRLTLQVKRVYGHLVDRYALGALAIGEPARREFVRWGIRPGKIRFLPYAVSGLQVADSQTVAEVQPGETRFLFLGQLCERKGIDFLLPAMATVLAAHPGARLELAGADRSAGAYEQDARRLGISHAVRFTGVIRADEIGPVLARSDVLVLPSRHDGWGVVLNEAASVGKALIASDGCGAAHHLIKHGVNGSRVPIGDVAALAAAMTKYCSDPALVGRHGAESLRLFQEFTPARNALRLEQALNSLQQAGSDPGLAWEA
jgi:glycosyltransferase involved in cell wall biosynthesis